MYKTIILIKYICLKIIFLLYFCSTSLAADYSKLPTIKKILFSTDEIHLSCFEDQIYLGIIVYSDEYKSVQFSGWKFEEASIKIDKSSTTQLVKFPVLIDPFELITINLENFNMIINQYESVDINDPSPPEDLLKAIYAKDMFNYFKNIKPSKTSNIDCGVTWAFKIRPIKENEELRRQILDEAIMESNLKECKGNDNYKWDNCVAFRGNYVGEYKDGWMTGHGIEFGSFGNFYIGSFFENYPEGMGVEYFSAWYEDVENFPQGKSAWTLKGLRVEGEWSDDNNKETYENLKKFNFLN